MSGWGSSGNAIDGGTNTARLSASEQDRIAREEREEAARRYLTRKGYADLLPVLGLAPAEPAPKRRSRGGIQ